MIAMTTETPTDSPTTTPRRKRARADKGKPNPNRAKRKRVLGDGEGDYCVMEVAGASSDVPRGSLVPIPEVPRFEDTVQAMNWIKKESGDLLAGKQVAVVRFMELLTLAVEMRPIITIKAKPKMEAPTANTNNEGEAS